MEDMEIARKSMIDKSFWQNKKIFITGHTGFKGSWLCLWLHLLGAEITGYALDPPTDPSLFKLCKIGELLRSVTADVRDGKLLKEAMHESNPEIVFHMAAQPLVRESYRDPVKTYSTNVMGTVNLFEAVRECKSVKTIINVTTDKCYENKEWIWGYRENDSMGGNDPYSSSKGCAELITNAYLRSYFDTDNYKEHGVSLASVRAGNAIGGGDWAEDRLVPDCMRSLMEDKPVVIRFPDAVRPWQHIVDLLYGYLLLTQHLYQEGSVLASGWNFGSNYEEAQPVRWIVERITEMWGYSDSWVVEQGNKPNEANFLTLDCSKAKSVLGWYPQWDLNVSLNKTVEWYKALKDQQNMFHFTLEQIRSYGRCIDNR